jgi:hypothetical protein
MYQNIKFFVCEKDVAKQKLDIVFGFLFLFLFPAVSYTLSAFTRQNYNVRYPTTQAELHGSKSGKVCIQMSSFLPVPSKFNRLFVS